MITEKIKKPGDRIGGAPDTPPLIRHIIWLMKGQNWRRHWKAILIACLVLAITPFIPKLIDNKSGLHLPRIDKTHQDLLSEDQIRDAIRKALHDGDVYIATSLLLGLSEGPVKLQECEHVFEFCIKNGKLNEANALVDQCWEGKQRKVKFARIKHEKLKR